MSSHFTPQQVVPIFSGGGTRLPAHVGILHAMQELNIEFSHLVGVSGGSIVSSLFSAGMPLEDIQQLAYDTDFNQFKGFSLIRLLKDGGLSSGNKFEQWLDQKLEGRCFSDLNINFHVLATDVNGGGPVVFNREQTPEVKVSQAVRYSMSIPLLFSFKSFRNHVMVDGAILSEDALFRDWTGNQTPVMCFRLRSDQQVNREFRKPMFPLRIYLMMLIRTFMNAISREYVQAEHWHNTIIVNTGRASAVDFKMSLAQKEELYRRGFATAMEFIPKKVQLYQYDTEQTG